MIIKKSTYKFLKDLAVNNNRDWFNAHKETYLEAQQNMVEFADQLILQMNIHDKIENTSGKKSLYRIYNDVRFSKDKSPYNARFAIGLQRASKLRRGGYYLHLKPGVSFLACGFFSPNPSDLEHIRQDISTQYKMWQKILNGKNIRLNFGSIQGETVKTAPRGYTIEHPGIELLRLKQFILKREFSDKEVLSENFSKTVNHTFKAVRPYFDYMSEILTTDPNGVSLL